MAACNKGHCLLIILRVCFAVWIQALEPRQLKTSLRDILGGALFYIGIPAVTLYPLGFIALSLQLWRDSDFPYNWAFRGFDFTMI